MRIINNDQISSCQFHLYTLIFCSLLISYYISNNACGMCLLESNSLGSVLAPSGNRDHFTLSFHICSILVSPLLPNSSGSTWQKQMEQWWWHEASLFGSRAGIAPGISTFHMMLSVSAIPCLNCFVILCWLIVCSFPTQFLREFSFLSGRVSLQLLK